ncbi:MAG: aspartyl protease family protein [Pseudomonadota bacterium]
MNDASLAARLPFELVGDFIFIRVSIAESKPLDFIFDTGAGTTVINSGTIQRLGLTPGRSVSASGAAGTIEVETLRDITIDTGDVALENLKVQASDLSHLERAIGRRIDGIIGYHLLRKRIVEINYDAAELRVHDRKRFRYRVSGQRIPLKARRHAYLKAALDFGDGGVIPARFIIDTGAGIALGLATPFVEKHDAIDRLGATYSRSSSGLSKERPTVFRARVPKVRIDRFTFDAAPASLYQVSQGFFSERRQAGVIGNVILKRFNIVFDYGGNQSWWEPNRTFSDTPFLIDCSGLSLALDADMQRVLIDAVRSDSPAFNAGLRAGDEIRSVDSEPVSKSPLHVVEERLSQDGTTVELQISRDGVPRNASLELVRPY